MRPRMLLGMDRLPAPSTTMLIREVENGYVVDIELKGDDQAHPVRFCKYIAQSHADLEHRVRVILEAFDGRKPESSSRIVGNLQSQEVDRKTLVLHQIKGGFLVVTAKPTRVKLDEAMHLARVRNFQAVCSDGEPLPEEYACTEMEEQIVIGKEAVVAMLAEFFGKPGTEVTP